MMRKFSFVICFLLLALSPVWSVQLNGPGTTVIGTLAAWTDTSASSIKGTNVKVIAGDILSVPDGINVPGYTSIDQPLKPYWKYVTNTNWTPMTSSGTLLTQYTFANRVTYTRIGSLVHMNIKYFSTTISASNVNRIHTPIPNDFWPRGSIYHLDRVKVNGNMVSATIEINNTGNLYLYAGVSGAASVFSGDCGIIGNLELSWAHNYEVVGN